MLIVSSSSGEQCLRGTWIRAFDGFCSLRNAVGGSVWLEKNNGGGGHNNFHRGILKVPVKLFSGEFSSWIVGIGWFVSWESC